MHTRQSPHERTQGEDLHKTELLKHSGLKRSYDSLFCVMELATFNHVQFRPRYISFRLSPSLLVIGLSCFLLSVRLFNKCPVPQFLPVFPQATSFLALSAFQQFLLSTGSSYLSCRRSCLCRSTYFENRTLEVIKPLVVRNFFRCLQEACLFLLFSLFRLDGGLTLMAMRGSDGQLRFHYQLRTLGVPDPEDDHFVLLEIIRSHKR